MEKQRGQDTFKSGVKMFKRMLSGDATIITQLKEDHKPLKELIKVMKDSDREFAVRVQAFKDFAPLLVTHAVAEEKSLYEFMKTNEELRQHAFEGDTEHSLADQLCETAERITDEDDLSAKIKVLAELVEHHIEEEENEIFPEVEKEVDSATLIKLSAAYIAEQEEIIAEGQDNSPSEREIPH